MAELPRAYNVRFHPLDLHHVDQVCGDILLLPIFQDDCPLRGLAGLVDWRLYGQVSQWMLAEHFSGRRDEALLALFRLRLPFERLVLFGLGPRADFDEARLRQAAVRIHEVLSGLQTANYTTVIPGLDALNLSPRIVLDLWLRARRVLCAAPDEPEADLFVPAEHIRAVNEYLPSLLLRLAAPGSIASDRKEAISALLKTRLPTTPGNEAAAGRMSAPATAGSPENRRRLT